MSKNKKLIPELRFPEFANEGEWEVEPLGNLSKQISEKTNGRKYKMMSITSGVGLVSQIEKFGREIAGNSYNNYLVIQNFDFAYNKSSTKLYPEGEIAIYEDTEKGAVPNSIFTCFRFDRNKIFPLFAKYPFINNVHGKSLKKFISVGARAHGALQVNSKDLFSVPFPYPKFPEQQKIASCLTSLDEVISTHTQKLELLKDHKKGLMQNLFPQEGEKVPKFRFPDFEKYTWEERKLSDVLYEHGLRSEGTEEVHSVSVHKGVVNQIEHLGRSYAASNTDHYKRVLPGDIIYTKSPTGDFPYGIIKQSKLTKPVIVSPLYGVFKPETESLGIILDAYFEHPQRTAKYLESIIQKGAKNTINISNTVFLSKSLTLPTDENEQKKIASCLLGMDYLIALQKKIIKQLKLHKIGLMQGLFPVTES